MGVLENLRAKREKAYAAAKAVTDKATAENRAFTDVEQAIFDSRSADLDRLDERIKEVAGEEKRAADAASVMDGLRGQPGGQSGPGRYWLPGLAEYRELQAEQRAVGTTGAFVPTAYSDTYFDLLRKRTAVLAAGPVLIPVSEAGSLRVPRVTSSVAIAGLAENAAITPADPGLSDIVLDPKKFGAMTLIAREALEDSRPELRSVVANSLVRDTAVELDRQLVTGDGVGNNLRGLRNTTGATAGPSTGVNGAALSFAFLADTLAAADGANLDPDRLAWIMHSRTWSSVRKLVDAQSRPMVSIDPTENVRPTLWGRPVFISNSLSIAETLGTSTDTSSILLCDMSQVVVAVARQVELQVSEDYAFNADQLAVRVTARYDIGVPQPTAVVLTTGVKP